MAVVRPRNNDHDLRTYTSMKTPKVSLEEYFFYTFLSLMAEIGGYVGLHIAMSVSKFFGRKADDLESEMEDEFGCIRYGFIMIMSFCTLMKLLKAFLEERRTTSAV